jgi:succinate-semialdehyde dehydrogenase/glutarate-semialdehyde dehydrogenase
MSSPASNTAKRLEVVEEVPVSRKEVTVCTNPATGEVIAEYPVQTVEDVINAVKNARRVQPAWQALPLKDKTQYVMKFAEYIQKHSSEIAEIISKDNGKTLCDAMVAEVAPAALATGYYCKNAARFLKDRKLGMGNIMLMYKRSRIVRVPFGVVGIISPWNYPFAIPYSEVVMGLLAGNTVILKAASEAQVVGHVIKECVEYAGLPEHVFTYINMPGSKAGDAFIDAGVDKLFFTGSVPVGKYLMKKASEKLTPLVLELGGNDAMIVCDDADLYRAA